MKKLYNFIIFATLLLSGTLLAQTYIISGKVTNTTTGENLIGANVYIASISIGAITNTDGFFTITKVPAGTYTLKASYIGYEPLEEEITVTANVAIDFKLTSTSVMLEDVVVMYSSESPSAPKKMVTPVSIDDDMVDIEEV